jgi:hypothetical protein
MNSPFHFLEAHEMTGGFSSDIVNGSRNVGSMNERYK